MFSVGVLSGKYGLIGILKSIECYDVRMDQVRAEAKAQECSAVLSKWADSHNSVHISLGKEYLPAVQPALDNLKIKLELFHGGIGEKLRKIKNFISSTTSHRRVKPRVEAGTGAYMYFLPDWDDLLDPNFDFELDSFSGSSRLERNDAHCSVLIKPKQISNGILVSLAQQGSKKGPLQRLEGTETGSLSPKPLRKSLPTFRYPVSFRRLRSI